MCTGCGGMACCACFDIVKLVALFVDFQWSVKFSLIMGVLDEQDGAVVGAPWLLA